MQLNLRPTRLIETVNGVPHRVWEGESDKGVKVKAHISIVQPQTHDEAALADFEREMKEVKTERQLQSFDIRLAL